MFELSSADACNMVGERSKGQTRPVMLPCEKVSSAHTDTPLSLMTVNCWKRSKCVHSECLGPTRSISQSL